jgi:Uma2 family endonuclease
MKLKTLAEIDYPESDGKPMAETDDHRDWMMCLIERLRRRYRGKKVYISGNLFIYYQEGDNTKVVAPDVFAVLQCEPRKRRIFKTWIEGKVPSFILETTSKKTRRADTGKKKIIFAQLGVQEYFLYDPLNEWLKPPLQGFRLKNGVYEPIIPEADGSLISKVLGIRFFLVEGQLVMMDLVSDEKVLNDAEMTEEAERKKTEAERKSAEAEKRLAEAQEELARLRSRLGQGNNGGAKNGK